MEKFVKDLIWLGLYNCINYSEKLDYLVTAKARLEIALAEAIEDNCPHSVIDYALQEVDKELNSVKTKVQNSITTKLKTLIETRESLN